MNMYSTKQILSLACVALLSMSPAVAQKVDRVEPLNWWAGMRTPLTLMVHGENLSDASVSVLESGLSVKKVRPAESPNYLFVDMEVERPGTYTLLLTKGRKKLKVPYVIAERRPGSATRTSFDASDVIYLIMPDRFANGNAANDNTTLTAELADRNAPFGRHGGDIQGICNYLDEIVDLGVTTVWCTPLLLDNEARESYHGYACADYYHIDPRFGSNAQYAQMADLCHAKGLKLIMDIVTNHCGSAHWWMRDLPFHDWIHQFPTFTKSNYVFSTNMDPNASKKDLYSMESGWFDVSMPDMNLDNPDLLQYFKQWAIWWVEYANLDGLRIDTYPYNEKKPMSEWCAALRNEYPNLNMVGECWTRPASQVAYWEADAANRDGFNSHLPSVMDFPLQEALCQALSEDANSCGSGLERVYNALAADYLYNDPLRLLVFSGNHDTERIGDIVLHADPRRAKLAITLLATVRGVPQLLYGEELMLRSSDRSQGHGGLRVDYPGHWPASNQALTDAQQDMRNYYRTLLQWRKQEPIIHQGKTLHFVSRNNTYAYFRYTEQGAVFVFLNASEEECLVPWDDYAEITWQYQPVGRNVLTGQMCPVEQPMRVPPLSALVLKLDIPK